MSTSEHDLSFPIICEIIKNHEGWINRDEIAQLLLDNTAIQTHLSAISNPDERFNRAGNMVDWVSAEFTDKSDLAKKYNILDFERERILAAHPISGNRRNIYQYRSPQVAKLPEEIDPPSTQTYQEGSIVQVWVNRYERDPNARKACLAHHKAICKVCGFDFERVYGKIGKDFIHVHHLVPMNMRVSEKPYTLDPMNDLVPVCPNCHAMLHKKNPPYSIDELRTIIKSNQK
jgi:5-methylcytosine-specific restriction endonuclease McrA